MRSIAIRWTLGGVVLALAVVQALPGQDSMPVYKDPDRTLDERVSDLLGRMTLEEKVAQMVAVWEDKIQLMDEDGDFVAAKAAAAIPHGVGHVARPSDRWGCRRRE